MFSHDTHQMPDEFILDYLPSALILDFLAHRDRAAPAEGRPRSARLCLIACSKCDSFKFGTWADVLNRANTGIHFYLIPRITPYNPC